MWEFFTRFLVRKQVELSEILSSRRTRSYARGEVGNNPKFVKYKEKTYQITEYDGVEDVTNDALDENVLIAAMSQEKPRKPKRDCPIKCGKNHINGSLFFCNKYRKKSQEERKAIQSKIPNLCILCLGPKGGKHDCPVTKCPRCGAMHNVLLCPAEEEDIAFVLNENNEWTENDEALGNPEMCYLIRKITEHRAIGAELPI